MREAVLGMTGRRGRTRKENLLIRRKCSVRKIQEVGDVLYGETGLGSGYPRSMDAMSGVLP